MEHSVKEKFSSYPTNVSVLLTRIRTLIFEVAKEDGIKEISEMLKWNEPSYLSKNGSTLRFDWKAKYPQQYCLYFNCKTSLVETFKELYGDTFSYQGNRAIIFQLTDELPLIELKHCISLSLRYHAIKHLPLLGSINAFELSNLLEK
ncbi:MAG: DUF1801 domain-containing protein [Colwellia sp.]|nr:DUF1801 domain-containing protein [Colwellia sp.]